MQRKRRKLTEMNTFKDKKNYYTFLFVVLIKKGIKSTVVNPANNFSIGDYIKLR